MRSLLFGLLLCGAALAAGGCWQGNIEAVRQGMVPTQVEEIMGPPTEVIRGDGADLGKKTYVYPTGRVHFVNQNVVLVEKAEEESTVTDRVREQREKDLPR